MSKKHLWIMIATALLALVLMAADNPGSGKPGIVGRWNRLNPGLPPESEVLRCGGNLMWSCTYDKHPEPGLGFLNPPEATFGRFQGMEATSEWACPTWFPANICEDSAYVVRGTMTFKQGDGNVFTVDEELILTESAGQQVLYVYWVDQFVCPWYRTFDEALAANSFPMPFNGTDGPEMDCTFAP